MPAPAALHPSEQTLQSYGLGKLDDMQARAVGEHLWECDRLPPPRRRGHFGQLHASASEC